MLKWRNLRYSRRFGLSAYDGGAFEVLTLNTQTRLLCSLLAQRAKASITFTVVCGFCCTYAQALCEASVGTSRQCSTRKVGQLPAISCVQKQTCSKSLPEAPVEKKKEKRKRRQTLSLCPHFPRDPCMIALICPDSIQPGVPLDFQYQTSVTQRQPHAD